MCARYTWRNVQFVIGHADWKVLPTLDTLNSVSSELFTRREADKEAVSQSYKSIYTYLYVFRLD